MFGKNPVAKPESDQDGEVLHIVGGSPFYTIQGEGPFSGDPAVFLRLHGCPLRCFFCDTEFSHPEDPRLDVGSIVDDILKAAPDWVRLLVITGGEPARQNLNPLITTMLEYGWTIQIETSGIAWQDCMGREGVNVVVSPKTGKIDQRVAWNAVAFKYVIQAGQVSDEDGLPVTNTQQEKGHKIKLARPWDYQPDGRVYPGTIYLSPMDEYDPAKNARNAQEVGRIAMQYGYRAGLQVHKHLNLP
jgi:7-carboxy-7-deazaguanine synthase